MFKVDDDVLARSVVETWVIKGEKGDPNCCPKCDGKVFEAEKMVSASVSFITYTTRCPNKFRTEIKEKKLNI